MSTQLDKIKIFNLPILQFCGWFNRTLLPDDTKVSSSGASGTRNAMWICKWHNLQNIRII